MNDLPANLPPLPPVPVLIRAIEHNEKEAARLNTEASLARADNHPEHARHLQGLVTRHYEDAKALRALVDEIEAVRDEPAGDVGTADAIAQPPASPTPITSPYEGTWATAFPNGVTIFDVARALKLDRAALREALTACEAALTAEGGWTSTIKMARAALAELDRRFNQEKP